MQMKVLREILPDYGLDPKEFPPVLFAAAMQGLALGLVSDEVAGYETAHQDARAAMSRLVTRLERQRARRRSPAKLARR